MVKLIGKFMGCMTTPAGKNREGEEYPARSSMQIASTGRHGRIEIYQVSIDDPNHCTMKPGQDVELLCSVRAYNSNLYFDSVD